MAEQAGDRGLNKEPEIIVTELDLTNRDIAQEYYAFINSNREYFEQFGAIRSHMYRNLKHVMESHKRDPNTTEYGIRFPNGHLVGNVSFMRNVRPRNTAEAEVGYLIAKEHRGNNIAARALLDVMSRYKDIRAFYASPHPSNTASHEVLGKAGFVRMKDDLPDGHLAFKYDRTVKEQQNL